ncbi:hypothetical protein [Streptomyces fagopyri]|uniref:hypothetical protein n=1 Tax=Streptomyces fagopyri TaxID=2662397 RepID=UPI0033C03114
MISTAAEGNPQVKSLIAHPDAVAGLILQAAAAPAAESARPILASTGSSGRGRDATGLGGIAGASLVSGTAAVVLGRRLGRRTH